MASILSKRVQKIKTSPTLAMDAKAKALQAQGKPVLTFTAGEPDFDTPTFICDAAIAAIRGGQTRYTPVGGTSALKNAIAAKFARENGLSYTAEEVLVSCGAKHALYNLCQAILDEGDEVIVPAPYWVSYPDIALLAGAVPRILSTTLEQQFTIDPQQLEQLITPKTKLLFLNSPNNPGGITYPRKELEAISQVLLNHPHVFIVTDDIYEHLCWAQEPFNNILNVCPELKSRTLVVNGVSKTYAMTGWRIGYTAGPAEIIQAMTKIQSQSTSNPTSVAQAAAVAALNGPQACLEEMVIAFKRRAQLLYEGLLSIPGIECLPASGAFYLFPKMTGVIQRLGLTDDLALGNWLLEELEIGIVPGTPFGCPDHIRFSFATSDAIIVEGLERMKKRLK